MKRAFAALAVLTLAGCFLQQNKPNANPTGPAIEGIVAIEDLTGPQSGAAFLAIFARAASSVHAAYRLTDARPQQSQCGIKRKALSAASSLISVGKLSFGTALQSSQITVDEDENHQYVRSLKAGYPSGVYEVSASGLADIPGFRAYLHLPEPVADPSVNAQAFGSSSVLIRKSQPLVAIWRPAAAPNSDHVAILDVETKTASEKITLHCIAVEDTLPQADGFVRWEIPASKLVDLPEVKAADIYLVRAIVKEAKANQVSLQMQGLRTHFTAAEVGG